MDQHWRKQRAAEAKALQKRCRTASACAAEAQPALTPCAHGLQVTSLHAGTVHPTPRYGTRGRPGPDTPPGQVGSPITGALASSLAAPEALVAPQRGCIVATNALDDRL